MNIFKKTPTMKKWGVLSWMATIVITAFVVIGVFFTDNDMTNLATVCGFAWADTAIYTAAYAYKEKAENKKKIAVSFIEQMADKYGVENVVDLARAVIEE